MGCINSIPPKFNCCATMPEAEEIRLRKLFRERKEVFAGDIGDVAFVVFYLNEIIELAEHYNVTFCIHRPTIDQ